MKNAEFSENEANSTTFAIQGVFPTSFGFGQHKLARLRNGQRFYQNKWKTNKKKNKKKK